MLNLEGYGFFDVALPFLLVFTVIYAILQKVNIFGPNSKNINVVVALVTAFFVIRTPLVATVLSQLLPRVSTLVLIIIMSLIVLGIFGFRGDTSTGIVMILALVLTLAGLGWSIYASLPGVSLPSWLRVTRDDVYLLVALAVGAGLIFWIVKGDDKNDEDGIGKAIKEQFSIGKFREGAGEKRK